MTRLGRCGAGGDACGRAGRTNRYGVELEGDGLRVELSRQDEPLVTVVNELSQLHQPAAADRLSADARRTRHRAPRPGFRADPGVRRAARGILRTNERPHDSPRPMPPAPPRPARITSSACWTRVLAGQEFATFAVSGGSTPKLLFQKLAATRFPWDRVHLFLVDERCVPPTDPASNYKLADDYLIHPAHIPHRHVHRDRRANCRRRPPRSGMPRTSASSSASRQARCRTSTWCIAAWARTRTPRACSPASR